MTNKYMVIITAVDEDDLVDPCTHSGVQSIDDFTTMLQIKEEAITQANDDGMHVDLIQGMTIVLL